MNDEREEKFRRRLILTAKGSHGARDMNREEAKEAMGFLFSDKADDIQLAAFVTAMRFKGAKVDELLGFIDGIKENSLPIKPEIKGLVDCNGPYDGRKKSLSLSFAAVVVAVTAGVPIIMHSGNRLPPKYGVTIADVLEALKIPVTLEPKAVEQMLKKTGFGFLHCNIFASKMEKFRHVRERLAYRSFLNTCEVLNNPANAKRIIFGAAHIPFLKRLTSVAQIRGADHVLAVRGIEGSDEIPLKKTTVVEYANGETKMIELTPEQFGLKEQNVAASESAEKTASIIYDILNNRSETYKQAVLFNAGIRIYLGQVTDSISKGIQLSREILESNQASRKLKELIGFSGVE
ncbi:MAG: anthranilate phosphoribosyltransferase [Nitrospinota bacterium]|jgi:anthranilate phosphoribosyltransferase|nr:anthranilate phosphoribosyltransferase [Nitrospinota bacterium]